MPKSRTDLIALSLPKSLKKRVDIRAAGYGTSRSGMVRIYLERGLKRDDEDDAAGNRELTAADWKRAMPFKQLMRIRSGKLQIGDVTALRKFFHMNRAMFAKAIGEKPATVYDWEFGNSVPTGAAVALLTIAARHPRVLRERLDMRSNRKSR
jgi:putative transcriptional regulator